MLQPSQQPDSKGRKTVMISSTARDLPEHRREVLDACLSQNMFPRMMEHLPASDADAIASSLKTVGEAEIYLGIFAHRYGYVPKGYDISITEMEYNYAVERKIPRLIFLMHDDHPIKATDVEKGEGAAKLEALKARLKTEQVINFFSSPADLRAHVINSLSSYRQPNLTAFYVNDISTPPESLVNTSVTSINIRSQPTSSKVKKLALLGLVMLVVVSSIISYATYQQRVKSLNTTATALAQQATTTASANTPQVIYNRITSSRPVLDAPLSKNDSYKWQEYTDSRGFGCIITGGSYHIYLQPYANLVCIAEATSFSNFAYQVQMTIIRGESGGIVFRVVDFNNNKYYYFYISPDGTYALSLSRDEHSSHDRLLRSGFSSFIKPGLKQSNLIAVLASGSNIYLYVNKQYVTGVSDSTYSSGQIGVYAIDIKDPTEVAFSHAQVWNV